MSFSSPCLSKSPRWAVVAVCLACFLPQASGRAVSHKGGTTMMFRNNEETNSLHLHYTPHRKYSLGYKLEHYRDEDFQLHMGQLNILMRRWNKRLSQANVYWKTGLGVAQKVGEPSQLGGFMAVATDWETQRYYLSYSFRYTRAGDFLKKIEHHARVGVAPYVGEYGDLHTWAMLGFVYEEDPYADAYIHPLIRFFKGAHLFEVGYSDRGILLNYIIRF